MKMGANERYCSSNLCRLVKTRWHDVWHNVTGHLYREHEW